MGVHEGMYRNGLSRPVENRMLAGVCAGLGERFGMSPWTARLLFVLVLMVIPGSQLVVYPILWLLMPAGSSAAQRHGGGPHGGPYVSGQYS